MWKNFLHVCSVEQSLSAALQARRAILRYNSFHVSFVCLLSPVKMLTNMIKVNSFIREYHEYQADWEPILGEIYKIMSELTNEKIWEGRECCSCCETKSWSGPEKLSRQPSSKYLEQRIWLRPWNTYIFYLLMAAWLTRFLKRQTNCRRVVIKGKWVNRGGDFGLEVPCEYFFLWE